MSNREKTASEKHRREWWVATLQRAAVPIATAALGFAVSTMIWQAKHEALPHRTTPELLDLEHRLTSIEANRFTSEDGRSLEARIRKALADAVREIGKDVEGIDHRLRRLEN